MGCSASIVLSHDTATNIRALNHLNAQTIYKNLSIEDKSVIKSTWNNLSKDMLGIGGKILLRLFQLNSQFKEIIKCTGLEGQTLINHVNFKRQASRYMQVLGAVVDNIDELEDTMGPVLVELGKIHFNFEGFLQKYWNLVPEAVLYVWNQELSEFTQDASKAWSALMLIIISMLKEGYRQACVEDTTKKLDEVINDTK